MHVITLIQAVFVYLQFESYSYLLVLNKMDEGTKQRIRTAGYNAGKVAGKLTTVQLALLQSFEEHDDIKAFLDEVMKVSTGKTIILLL